MKREFIKLAGLILLISFLTVVCEDQQTEFPPGSYQYQGFDINFQKVTEGDIVITVDDSLITGQKNIQITATNLENQLDAGEGTIEGRIQTDEAIYIRFTYNKGPNLYILGHFKNDILSGKRFVESIAGTMAIGTFIAQERR